MTSTDSHSHMLIIFLPAISAGYDNYLKIISREINIEAVKYFCSRLRAVQCVDPALMLLPSCVLKGGRPIKNVPLKFFLDIFDLIH